MSSESASASFLQQLRVMSVRPSASFSATLRVHLDDRPGAFADLARAIGDAGGNLGAIDLVRVEQGKKVRDVTVDAASADHIEQIVAAVARARRASRSSTSPTGRSCCTSAARSRWRRSRR